MGFGILLFGYFITTMVPIPLTMLLPIDISGFVKMLGYVLVIIAAKKLSEYNSSFGMLVVSSFIMSVISAFDGIVDLGLFLTTNQIVDLPFANVLKLIQEMQIVDYLDFAVIIFVAALCLSVKKISEDTGVQKVVTASIRNLVFFAILFIVQAIRFLPFAAAYKNELVSASLIIELVCQILTLYMIFYCYAKICDSSDVDMKRKESRFSFVNKRRAEREEERNKIIDEFENKKKKKK